jgi:hypothetical protein
VYCDLTQTTAFEFSAEFVVEKEADRGRSYAGEVNVRH